MSDPRPKTTKFVLLGASLLAALAGYINTIFLSLQLFPVSHMSGTLSRLSLDTATGHWDDIWSITGIILGFVGGALVSGLVIGDSLVRLGRRYGLVLALEGCTLASAAWLLHEVPASAMVLAAVACGLQNGMASNYRGMIIRTTHITGAVTDLGVLMGRWIRYRSVNPWQFALLLITTFSFVGGGSIGVITFRFFGDVALWLAAFTTFVVGFMYFIWKHFLSPRLPATEMIQAVVIEHIGQMNPANTADDNL
jgi:uncharacterized membrane protein YoaK (UPF0700 family)